MTAPTVTMACRAAGRSLALVRVALHESISQPSRAVLEVATSQELEPASLLRGAASLELLVRGAPVRSLNLLIAAVTFRGIERNSLRYVLELRPPLWLLGLGRDTRKFRSMDAQQIITQVLGEGGVGCSWRLQRQPAVRKYCVQYRESNLAFVSRLLEAEGIYYSCEDDGTVRLADHSASSPSIAGEAELPLLGGQHALAADRVGISRFGRGARVASGKATVNDYNWKTPRVPLLASCAAGQDSELEIYDFPSGYRTPAQGRLLAQLRLDALRARARFVRGEGNVPALAPARLFSVAGGGQHLVTDVRHTLVDPAYTDDTPADAAVSYQNRFDAVAASVPFRPALVTPRPTVQGCHTVMVRGPAGEEIHTDRHGRFRAQFHWDREARGNDEDSRWLRKLQEPTSSLNLARVGWEVSVAYIDGDPDRPIGLARTINGVMRPSYSQPAKKQVMTIKTPSYPGGAGFNEIMLDDAAGAQRFSVRAERDFTSKVLHDKTETIGNDDVCSVGVQFHHDVRGCQTLQVGGDRVTGIGQSLQVKVGGAASERIGGDLRITCSGPVGTNVKSIDREVVGSLRLSIVGGISLPDPAARASAMVPDPKGTAKNTADAGAQALMSGGGAAGAGSAMGGSLQSMVPTPEGAAGQLTGGLSNGSLSGLVSGNINRAAEDKLHRCADAALLVVSAENINGFSRLATAETIGGAKCTITAGDIAQRAGHAMTLTVGGALLRKTGADASYASKVSRVIVGGMLRLKSDERVEIQGSTVSLQAATQLRFKSGSLELNLGANGITAKGSVLLKADEKIIITGKDDDLTQAAE